MVFPRSGLGSLLGVGLGERAWGSLVDRSLDLKGQFAASGHYKARASAP